MRTVTDFLFCILPSGNKEEYPDLDRELVRRGVKAEYWEYATDCRIYRIPAIDLQKLPCDKNYSEDTPAAPYLGDDNSGHSIYQMSEEALKVFEEDLPYKKGREQKWVPIVWLGRGT